MPAATKEAVMATQWSGVMAARGRERVKAWEQAEEEARCGARALGVTRERLRVARQRSRDRRRLGNDALAAGQEVFAQGLLDAADAHETIARDLEASLLALERRYRALRREADARQRAALDAAEAPRPGERPGCDACRWREVA
jgi:hypothetical protein